MPKYDTTREVLADLEFAGRANGDPACAYCKAKRPLDAANPRAWEQHAADCKWAAAAAEMKAEAEAETSDEAPSEPSSSSPSTDPAGSTPADPSAPQV